MSDTACQSHWYRQLTIWNTFLKNKCPKHSILYWDVLVSTSPSSLLTGDTIRLNILFFKTSNQISELSSIFTPRREVNIKFLFFILSQLNHKYVNGNVRYELMRQQSNDKKKKPKKTQQNTVTYCGDHRTQSSQAYTI